MKFEINIHQMKDVLMLFDDAPKFKNALRAAVIWVVVCAGCFILAVAWRISGL